MRKFSAFRFGVFVVDLGNLFVYVDQKTNCQVFGIYLPEWLSCFFWGERSEL